MTITEGSTVTTGVYGYDDNGNRTSLSENGILVATGMPDGEDRLLSYGMNTYTDAGDLLTKTDSTLPPGQDTTTYSYDALGNLIQVVLPDGRNSTYAIDGQNRRVAKWVDGALERGWVYQTS